MADVMAKAWQVAARQLANELPGEWQLGGTGIRTNLIRIRDHWIIDWIGLSRARRDDLPRLMGGLTPLTARFNSVGVFHGISGNFLYPGSYDEVDFTGPQATTLTSAFAQAVLDKVDPWTPQQLANEAENQLAQPEAERSGPASAYAAGWRVVLNTGSPVEPATEMAAWSDRALVPDDAVWYRSLIQAWQGGGRPATLAFLEKERTEALASLKLK